LADKKQDKHDAVVEVDDFDRIVVEIIEKIEESVV
jgi:hypothetical protein